jgi:large subunit ribosomal protein L21
MYAIVKDGSRQIKVEEGQEVSLDYRSAKAGDEITLDRVLVISDDDGTQLGQPTLDGASVTAEVVGTTQGPKLVVQKFRRRKNSRRKTGHRQLYTKVKINKIQTA